jgi:Spy/CpxP family protein refolding chaperone
MKTIKCLLITVALAAGAASAQPPGPPEGPGGPGNIERLTILLDLDAYQATEVARILKEQREAGAAAREAMRDEAKASGERPSFAERGAKRDQLEAETLTKLQAVLTEPQITKFKVLMEGPGPGGRGPGGRGPDGRRGADK